MKAGVIQSNGNGLFSNFRGTVAAFYECDKLGLTPLVEWTNSIYKDVRYGNNVWDYYFEPICVDSLNKINMEQNREWKRESFTRERMSSMIKKYVIVKPHIKKKIDSFWEDNFSNNNVLGVHLRLTDKLNCTAHGEPISGLPVQLDYYIKHIHKYLNKENNSKIFLATDSLDGLDRLKHEFGDSLVYREDVIRSSGYKSVHHDLVGDNYKKGEDVLIDCLLLSKSNFLFKGISCVALAALFFNDNLDHFNLNEYYNNDKRESFIKTNLTYV